MKKTAFSTLIGAIALTSAAHGQFNNATGSLLLGGGYLEDPNTAYGFGQFRATVYEDDAFAHTFFFEILGHADDAELDFGTFTEDGDITFINLTLNYELEAKLFGPISAYAGGGAGVEIVNVDDRFNFSLDSDSNFVGQVFLGLRANYTPGFVQIGARYLFRDDFELLGDQFETNDSWAFEIGGGFRF